MRLACTLVIAGILLIPAMAHAGSLHPALEARLLQTPPDEPLSVIVNMREQAPVAELTEELRYTKASPAERHRVIIEALRGTARLQDGLKADLSDKASGGGVLGYTSYWISNLMVVYALPGEIRRIAARPDVDVVELNFSAELIAPTRPDPAADKDDREAATLGVGVTPGLRAIRAPEVWSQFGYNGTGRLIGSLDTGVDGNHPALRTRWRGYNGGHPWSECWLDLLGTGTQFPTDTNGHGTHTTGTMTGLGAATQDTIGVAWGAQWIACNAINQVVSGSFDQDIIAAFQWFADPDGNPNTLDDVPDVVQNSWGITESSTSTPPYADCDSRWWSVIDNCEAAGVVTCWSAGNEGAGGAGTIRSPADRATTLTNTFSVGAVSAMAGQQFPYGIAGFSSRGPSGCNVSASQKIKPEVCAPGVQIYSSVPGGAYQGNWDGTSMAGPHVAGIVALIRQANPGLDVDAVKTILMQTARDEGITGEDNTYGWGFVDAQAAVLAATLGYGRLEGHLWDASWNRAPLPGARVTLVGTGIQFTTDAQGFYRGSVAAGSYLAQASLEGFQSQSFQVVITSNQTTTWNLTLLDIAGPAITGVSEPSATSDKSGPYIISATINDPSTVTSATLSYRLNSGPWIDLSMLPVASLYQAAIPGQQPGNRIDYYVRAVDGPGLVSASPAGAPGAFYSLYVTRLLYSSQAESVDAGWQLGMAGDNATSGFWIDDDPVGTTWNDLPIQPEDDHTPNPGTRCFVTGNGPVGAAAGDADVDNGCTSLRSPVFDLGGAERAFLSYWRWYGMNGNSADDTWAVDVSNDGGVSWVPLERVPENRAYWEKVTINLDSIITLTNQVVLRFRACDLGASGLIEAAVDDISIETFTQDPAPVDDVAVTIPAGLDQNCPNPFRPGTTLTNITFRLASADDATIAIFDASGRRVRTLFHGPMRAGVHTLVWNGLDDGGNELGAGVYFYRLSAGAYEQSRRMVLVR
jgi:subtilisin family serine protease